MTNQHPPTEATTAAASTAPPQTASIHDTFFYKVLSNPKHAAAELQSILSKEVSEAIDWDSLEVDPHRFVDGNLGNHFADILLSARVRGKRTYIHLLFEHSSGPKSHELLQSLRYQVRIWEKEKVSSPEEGLRSMTPILTVILHHSDGGWRGRRRFADYFGLDEELARIFGPYLVDFGVVVDDISKVNAEALMSRPVPPEVHVLLFALRFGRTGREVLLELPRLAPTIGLLLGRENGRLVVATFLVYMKKVAKVSETELRMALQETYEPALDPEIAALWDQFEAGQREGEIKGQRKLLKNQLSQRFGVLSPQAIACIDQASARELEAMGSRVLTASTLDEALGRPAPRVS